MVSLLQNQSLQLENKARVLQKGDTLALFITE